LIRWCVGAQLCLLSGCLLADRHKPGFPTVDERALQLPLENTADEDQSSSQQTVSPYQARTVDPNPRPTPIAAPGIEPTGGLGPVSPVDSPPLLVKPVPQAEPAPLASILPTSATPQPGPSAQADPPAQVEPPAPAKPSLPTKPPVPAENSVLAALRAIQERRLDDARQRLQEMDGENRDLLIGLLRLAALLSQQKGINAANAKDLNELLQEVDQLGAVVRPWVPLALPRVCFCRRVENFGVYEPLPENRSIFQAGLDDKPGERVTLYVEVGNFASQTHGQKPDECYETALAGTLEIRDKNLFASAGNLVWRRDFPAKLERSRTPRQDYYMSFFFHIPPRVPPGHYTLVVEVRDEIHPAGVDGKPRLARKSLDFDVVENRSSLGTAR